MKLAAFLKALRLQNRKLDENLITLAYQFADQVHLGQIRYDGQAYLTHPLEVALILSSWGVDQDTIVAGILHDTLDHGQADLQVLNSKFNPQIVKLVEGVTRVGQVQLRGSRSQYFVENLRKMFISMAKDIRVVLIRLADRLHNMRTLDAVPISKQRRIALETINIYAPLAERLGMGLLKGELEDLSFPYAYPKTYLRVSRLTKRVMTKVDRVYEELLKSISSILKEHHLEAKVEIRKKRLFSLFHKLKRPEIKGNLSRIHDLVAARIITTNLTDCYAVLGLVHQHWQPVPGSTISDFIQMPKPNGYQSLHTKVIGSSNFTFEIQIRDEKMHHQAEYGAASHALYSQAKQSGATDEQLEKGISSQSKQKMKWIEELAKWQSQVADDATFLDHLKLDALSKRIYVFSPKGDVYDLPENATPVDFAFAVHSELPFFLSQVLVNGKLVPLSHLLKSRDVVEVIKSKQKRALNRDWLKFTKTAKARLHLKALMN